MGPIHAGAMKTTCTFKLGSSSFAGSRASVRMSTVQCPGFTALEEKASSGYRCKSWDHSSAYDVACAHSSCAEKSFSGPGRYKKGKILTDVVVDNAQEAVKPERFLLMLYESQWPAAGLRCVDAGSRVAHVASLLMVLQSMPPSLVHVHAVMVHAMRPWSGGAQGWQRRALAGQHRKCLHRHV